MVRIKRALVIGFLFGGIFSLFMVPPKTWYRTTWMHSMVEMVLASTNCNSTIVGPFTCRSSSPVNAGTATSATATIAGGTVAIVTGDLVWCATEIGTSSTLTFTGSDTPGSTFASIGTTISPTFPNGIVTNAAGGGFTDVLWWTPNAKPSSINDTFTLSWGGSSLFSRQGCEDVGGPHPGTWILDNNGLSGSQFAQATAGTGNAAVSYTTSINPEYVPCFGFILANGFSTSGGSCTFDVGSAAGAGIGLGYAEATTPGTNSYGFSNSNQTWQIQVGAFSDPAGTPTHGGYRVQ